MASGLSLNLIEDVRQLLSYHFMLNALRAGTIVAVVAGAIGYFMVLRRQSFAGHTLAVIGFPGAAAAAWLGVNAGFGYFGLCLAGALIIAALPANGQAGAGLGSYREESAAIGTLQAFALACGFLFVSLYQGFLSDLNNLLFGAITGVSDDQVLVLLLAGVACLIVLARHCPAAAVQQRGPGGGSGPGSSGPAAVGDLLAAAGHCGGRHQPDHRQPAGLRPAGRTGRHRSAAHPPAGDRCPAVGADCGRGDLAG